MLNQSRFCHRLIAVAILLALIVPTLVACNGNKGGTITSGAFGGRLHGGSTFSLFLVVLEEQSDIIDYVGVVCAPEGHIKGAPVIIASNVEIRDCKFSMQTDQVVIKGEFVSPTSAQGTITGLVPDTARCGIPSQGTWTSEYDMNVHRLTTQDEGTVLVTSSAVTTEGGTAYSRVICWPEDNKGFEAELM
jgi:hypothetical protein